MRNFLLLTLVVGLVLPFEAQTKPVAERLTQQNALFEEYFQTGLKRNPQAATSLGDFRYNALLGDASLAATSRYHAEDDALLTRLQAISTEGMEEPDQISHDLLVRQLQRGDVNYELKNYEMPVNQQNGVHTGLADLPLSVPLDSVQHYEDYIARLKQIPRVLDQTTEVMRQGLKDGLMPPKIIVDKLPGQCEGILAANPFLLPLKKFPASFSDADRTKLTAEMTAVVNGQVFPAYRKFMTFLREEYDPKGRVALSVESLPDGKRRYREAVKMMTTAEISPEAVHELGLSEVAHHGGDDQARAGTGL